MPSPRHLPIQLRRARRLRPGLRFLVREVLIRRSVTRSYMLRQTGQRVTLRHRTPDLGGLVEVFVNANYELPPEVRQALLARPGPVRAVDLGANIGLFGLSLLSQIPDSVITAYEPDPSSAAIMRETIAANGHGARWRVIEACAGTRDGTVAFRSGHFLESRIADDGDPVPVCDVFPVLAGADLIKIDIEGAEYQLLRDRRFERLQAHALWLEFHPPHVERDILQLIRRAGFDPGTVKRRAGVGELWATRRANA